MFSDSDLMGFRLAAVWIVVLFPLAAIIINKNICSIIEQLNTIRSRIEDNTEALTNIEQHLD